MEELQTARQTGRREFGQPGISRIETVKDPAVNKALFTLYGNLIEPLERIERTRGEIMRAQEAEAKTRGEVKLSMADVFSCAVSMYLKVFILSFIAIYILAHFIETLGEMDILPALRMTAVIAAALSLVIAYAKNAGSVASQNRIRRARHEEALDVLANLEPDLERQIDRIKNVICFVPPSYRFSGALRYFAESYANSRVDDLKEAVNAYDTYYFRSQSAQMQQQILDQERANAATLSRIEYSQLCMMEQLEGIRGDIWLAGGLYDFF